MNRGVEGSIPSQGPCLGCKQGPGGARGNHTLVFLSLSPSLPLSKINNLKIVLHFNIFSNYFQCHEAFAVAFLLSCFPVEITTVSQTRVSSWNPLFIKGVNMERAGRQFPPLSDRNRRNRGTSSGRLGLHLRTWEGIIYWGPFEPPKNNTRGCGELYLLLVRRRELTEKLEERLFLKGCVDVCALAWVAPTLTLERHVGDGMAPKSDVPICEVCHIF